MPRDYRLQLTDILDAINFIDEITQGMDIQGFKTDRLVRDAVIRNLQVIGEAARVLPEDIKQQSFEIEWHEIVGTRNIIIHQYFGIDLDIIWNAVKENLPELKRACEFLL
jgi:uncharacterized protein with HEPN domain